MPLSYDSSSSDDEEDKCPLCIEDMDITDKNFKPCPCGFQICQFCYNNIRSGPEQYNRCPACRRPYDDESIEYKTLTPEEMKQEQERKQRKELAKKHREREKHKDLHHHHFDQKDKKHLSSVRVIQKNLVYVIGLNPNIPSEDLQQMLRRDEYFGQYGKIHKIVVNKRVNGNGNLGVGVYVTFARKEDAARCIAAVDGSVNDGKYLRAAYGTTKYCSSYLRGQNCPNQNCMFLHEPGEEADSFNRHPNPASGSQGLSSSTNLPLTGGHLSASASPVSSHSHLSPHQASHTAPSLGLTPAQSAASASPSPLPVAAQLGATASANHSAVSGGGGAAAAAGPGSMASTANAPALPAWGKTVPQIPPVHKLIEHDLPNTDAESLRILEQNLASLAKETWDFQFVSDIVGSDAEFPPMFSLPIDDKKRLKAHNKALAELDRIAQEQAGTASASSHPLAGAAAQQHPDQQHQQQQQPNDSSRASTASLASSRSESRAETKKNNSQHLLAHLMRGASPAAPQPERKEEDTHHFESPQRPEEIAEESPVTQAPLDHNEAAALLERYNRPSENQLVGLVAETLRQVGGDLMQPAAPTQVAAISADTDLKSTNLVDDGPAFDLKKLPEIQLAGDTAPSVWSAIEELNRQRELYARREKEFSAVKSQTKKRMKRLRV